MDYLTRILRRNDGLWEPDGDDPDMPVIPAERSGSRRAARRKTQKARSARGHAVKAARASAQPSDGAPEAQRAQNKAQPAQRARAAAGAAVPAERHAFPQGRARRRAAGDDLPAALRGTGAQRVITQLQLTRERQELTRLQRRVRSAQTVRTETLPGQRMMPAASAVPAAQRLFEEAAALPEPDAALSAADISRFFERDARRYG